VARRTLQLIKEFLFPDSAEHRAIPVLDGSLSPNDDLDTFEALTPPGLLEPTDVLPTGGGEVLAAGGDAIWRIATTAPAEPAVLARLGGAVGPLAAAPGGGVLAGLAGHGLAHVGGDGAADLVAREVEGTGIGCLTALAAIGDRVYATEGSTTSSPDDWARNLLEGRHDGRLLEIDPATGRARVVAAGLAWPAGVCPAAEGDQLLVTEAWHHRVVRVDPALGATTVVRDNLPGYPAQIHPAAGKRFWLSFLSLRTHLVEFVLREDEYRDDMLASVPSEFWIRPALRTTGDRWEPLQIGQVKHLNVTKPWAPPRSYGLVARMDGEGRFDTGFHSRAGGLRHGCLSAREEGDRLLVASAGGRTVLRSPALTLDTQEARR
jgi:hypothetical protein